MVSEDRYDSQEFHELMMNYRSANFAAQTPADAYEAVQAFIRADGRLSKACELLKLAFATMDCSTDHESAVLRQISAFLAEVGHE